MEELQKFVGEGAKLEHPTDLTRGDFSFHARGKADELTAKFNQNKPDWLEKVEVVGSFVNFFLSPKFFADSIAGIIKKKERFGEGKKLVGQKTVVEYTDPNPFKEFHIGHLMSNTIGESVSRLIESQGAEVKRACYQGDVGLHVAKAIYGMRLEEANFPPETASLQEKAKFLGRAYAAGATVPEFGVEEYQKGLVGLNKTIYDRSSPVVNKLYDWGRKISLDYFEIIYEKLGTKFDFYFFESKTGEFGKQVVEEGLAKGVFEKSDGAVIFKGDEKEGLHTRVFINSEGLPTYEAKELGLAKIKFETYPYDRSVVVTGNEINAYFQVLLKVMSLLFPDLAQKTIHLSHGMLRLPTGKMSSRTGDIITAEALLANIREKLGERGSDEIAVAALKYSILRQSPGKDIIFDFDKSLSFEGDSGPYLQYTCVRAKSVLEKAAALEKSFFGSSEKIPRPLKNFSPALVEKLLYRFPEVVERAAADYAPNYLVTYLTDLASAFNSYYAQNKIIGSEEESYRLALTAAVAQTLENGLDLLGIKVPGKM